MVVKWHAEGTTKLLQLILNNPVWRNALFSQSIFNAHKQSLTTQAITIEMFHDDTGWRHEMSREGLIEIKQDGSVVATAKWTSRFPDPVRNRLYTIKDWMKKGKFVKEFGVDPAWTRWKQIPKDRRDIMKLQYPYYFLLRELVSTDAPYAPPMPADTARNNDRMDIDEAQEPEDVSTQASSSKTTDRKRQRPLDLRTPEPEIVYRPASRSPTKAQEPLDEKPSVKKARKSDEPEMAVPAQPIEIEVDDPAEEAPLLEGSRYAPIEVIEIDDDTSATAFPAPSPSSTAISLESESASKPFHMSAEPDSSSEDESQLSDHGRRDGSRFSRIAGSIPRDTPSVAEDEDTPWPNESGRDLATRNVSAQNERPWWDDLTRRHARDTNSKRKADHLVTEIIAQQTLDPPLTEAGLLFDWGRMFYPPPSLDLSSLALHKFQPYHQPLHAFHYLLRAFRSVIRGARKAKSTIEKMGRNLCDVDVFVDPSTQRTCWLEAVLTVVEKYGGRVIANGNEASRPFCFILSSFSPIFPDNIETETQECSNPTTAALISALNLLRFIDYRQLHRKWVEKGSHMRIGKHTCPAPTASWAGFSHLEPDEWFKLGKATRVTDLSMLRIRWLVDDMEHANAYAPKRHKARGFVVGQVVHDSALGQLGVRIRALARAYGLAHPKPKRKKGAKGKNPPKVGNELFYVCGIDIVPDIKGKPKHAETDTLLDFVSRLARLT